MFLKLRLWIGLSMTLILSIILSACGPTSQPAPDSGESTPVATQQPVTEIPTTIPTVVQSGVQEYTNENFGFSLSYPEGFELENSVDYSFVFRAPPDTPGHRERAFLQVEQALDKTAEWFANQAKQENSYLGTSITVSEIEIGGQKAYILGQMPGQDINRQVFVVNQGFLYHLTFMPDNSNEGEAYQQMVSLYAVVIDTLTFLPDRMLVPPILTISNMANQIERMLEARSAEEITRTLGDEFMVLEWLSPGTSFMRLSRDEAAPVILNNISATPDLIIQSSMGWPNVEGGLEQFTGYFPNETVIPVLVQGWGPQGSDEAVIILGRYTDGSLYWRGVLVTQGAFPR